MGDLDVAHRQARVPDRVDEVGPQLADVLVVRLVKLGILMNRRLAPIAPTESLSRCDGSNPH